MSAVTLSFFAILISLVVLWSPVTQGKDGPSVGEHDNSLAEYFAHPQISNLKAHCGCPPRAIKASSNLEQNVDTKACLYRVGTQVKYSCLNGHVKLSGSEHLECILKDDQALWDKDPLQCESKLFCNSF